MSTEMKRSMNALHGMKAIAEYYGKSESTILKLVRDFGFPARNIAGGWTSDRTLIDNWNRDYVAGNTEKWLVQ